MPVPLIIANWKTNPASPEEAADLAVKIDTAASGKNAEVVVAPPLVYLAKIGTLLKKAKLGAQNAVWSGGAYTGEVSVEELKKLGVRYIIVGHSERRIKLNETDEMVNKKVQAALKEKMKAVLCVGERIREGREIPEEVGEELRQDLAGIKAADMANLIVAYEPVWAISGNADARADSPEGAFKALIYIRKILTSLFGAAVAAKARVIYGGSVDSKNIAGFLEEGKMEGVLVGRASLNAEEFSKIILRAGNFKS